MVVHNYIMRVKVCNKININKKIWALGFKSDHHIQLTLIVCIVSTLISFRAASTGWNYLKGRGI